MSSLYFSGEGTDGQHCLSLRCHFSLYAESLRGVEGSRFNVGQRVSTRERV